MRRVTARVCGLALAVLAIPAVASAQLHLQFVGGMTSAAAQQPFVAGSLGVRISFLEVDVEAGHLHDILPKGVLDGINQLQRDRGLPVQAIAQVPATYVLGNVRLISPSGPVHLFVNGGVGVARLQPRLIVVVDGVSLGDVFGLTDFKPQNKTMASAGGGVRVDVGHAQLEVGYRYLIVFTRYDPNFNVTNDKVLTYVNSVYGAFGIRF